MLSSAPPLNRPTLNKNGKGLIKLLVVDDDQETTDLLQILLESDEFEVVASNSGLEGMELAHRLAPDLMIIDLNMPEMDGFQLCQEIRKFSDVPILVLSAVGKPGVMERVLSEGADDYLLKPMNSTILIAQLRKLARRARIEKEVKIANNGSHGNHSS